MSTRFGTLTRTLLGLLLLLTLCAQPVQAGPSPGPQDGAYASPPPEDVAASSAATVGGGCVELLVNGGFETGNFTGWTTSGSPTVIGNGGHTGWYSAQLGGRNNASDTIAQSVAPPFVWWYGDETHWVYMYTEAPSGTTDDYLIITTRYGAGPSLATRLDASYLSANTWTQIGGTYPYYYPGPWQVSFQAITDSVYRTWFLIDSLSWGACCKPEYWEPNDTFRSAYHEPVGSYEVHLCPSGDEDWFVMDLTAGDLIYLGLGIKEEGQATVCLVAPDGSEVACDSEVYPNTAVVLRTATMSGGWRMRVYDPGYLTRGSLLQLDIGVGFAPTPTASPTLPTAATPTRTGVATLTSTAVARPTNTPTHTAVATLTRTQVATPTRTAVATLTRTSTRTPTRTATRTAVATPTRTPTRTRTRTPWPTPYGGPKRLSLPLLLRRR